MSQWYLYRIGYLLFSYKSIFLRFPENGFNSPVTMHCERAGVRSGGVDSMFPGYDNHIWDYSESAL